MRAFQNYLLIVRGCIGCCFSKNSIASSNAPTLKLLSTQNEHKYIPDNKKTANRSNSVWSTQVPPPSCVTIVILPGIYNPLDLASEDLPRTVTNKHTHLYFPSTVKRAKRFQVGSKLRGLRSGNVELPKYVISTN